MAGCFCVGCFRSSKVSTVDSKAKTFIILQDPYVRTGITLGVFVCLILALGLGLPSSTSILAHFIEYGLLQFIPLSYATAMSVTACGLVATALCLTVTLLVSSESEEVFKNIRG